MEYGAGHHAHHLCQITPYMQQLLPKQYRVEDILCGLIMHCFLPFPEDVEQGPQGLDSLQRDHQRPRMESANLL
jgi:hypothetical protein